jgi:transcription elongation factor GreB
VSKAFTSEEPNDPLVVGRQVQRAAPGAERPITPSGYQRLLDELNRLQAERASLAATDDLRASVDHRLALVSATLSSVRVVEPLHDGKVRFGSTVTLRWEDGREQTLSFVGPDEADAKAGRVSIESPLGKSLLERGAGDTVEIERPRGVEEATIVSVR